LKRVESQTFCASICYFWIYFQELGKMKVRGLAFSNELAICAFLKTTRTAGEGMYAYE